MIDLKKKQSISLAKNNAAMEQVTVGLSWDESDLNGKTPDADASVFMLDSSGKVPNDGFFIFYNNLVSPDGAVRHNGDNRTGAGDGDDETVDIDLVKIAPEIQNVYVVVTIHNATDGFNFGNVVNASVRVYDRSNRSTLCEFRLSERYPEWDAMILGRLYRSEQGWSFEAMGDGFSGGLQACLDQYT